MGQAIRSAQLLPKRHMVRPQHTHNVLPQENKREYRESEKERERERREINTETNFAMYKRDR